jgi:hypothetical protein
MVGNTTDHGASNYARIERVARIVQKKVPIEGVKAMSIGWVSVDG